jgi:hypothetical protein
MLQESELAKRVDGVIEIRTGGLRVRWELSDLITSDGHAARAIFSCTVRGLPDPTEQKMLEEALLSSRSTVATADLAEHFSFCLVSAARTHARSTDAEALLNENGRRALAAALLDAGSSVAFTCGVELLAPTQLDLDCPSLRRHHAQILRDQTARRQNAETIDQIRRSAELLQQFQGLQSSAGLAAGPTLDKIARADQADVLRSLLLASAQDTTPATLWAVAGNYLIRAAGPTPSLIPIPDELGPLRSVQSDGSGGLLLGARSGIWRTDASLMTLNPYTYSAGTSVRGFNAAVVAQDKIWAAHSESGLISWPLSEPTNPTQIHRADFSPRNLSLLNSQRLILTSGKDLYELGPDSELKRLASADSADMCAVFVQPHRFITAHEDGVICIWDRENMTAVCRRRLAGNLVAAAALPWLDDVRILISTDEGPIQSVGLEDNLVTHYASPHLAVRRLAASAHAVAAVTSDRQRLLLWNAWDGLRPSAEYHLYGLTRHRIADMAFV